MSASCISLHEHPEQLIVGEQILVGQAGFWQHWFDVLHEHRDLPMPMDLIIPDTPEVLAHNWANDVQTEILEVVMVSGATAPRVIVPPCDEYSSLGSVADTLTNFGVDVRVRSTKYLFAVYGAETAVLSLREDPTGDDTYVVTSRRSIVLPLQGAFVDHWSSALPWQAHVRGTADVLDLMSLGWTDARIAQKLGLSMRTLSRRVADAMTAVGASSRFELGMKYAVSRSPLTAPAVHSREARLNPTQP